MIRKKFYERLCAILIALTLTIGCAAFSTAAAGSPSFAAGTAAGAPGDTVTVDVSVRNNPGIVSMKLMIGYDAEALTLTAINGKDFADVSFGPLAANPIAVNWDDVLNPNNTANGVIAQLTFTIKECEADDKPITITYDPEDVYNANFENVAFSAENGFVTVKAKETEEIKIVKTGIKADSVYNTDGYAGLGIKGEMTDFDWYVTDPQAALMSPDGKLVFPFKDTYLNYHYDSVSGVVSLTGDYHTLYETRDGNLDRPGFYELNGKVILNSGFAGAIWMHEGCAIIAVSDEDGFFQNERTMKLIDRNGKTVYTFPKIFGSKIGIGGEGFWFRSDVGNVLRYQEGLIGCYILQEGDGWWDGDCIFKYVDKNGNVVLTLEEGVYDSCSVFSEGLAYVRSKETGLYGYINRKGEEVIPCQFDECDQFSDGLAMACMNGKWGYIDHNGNTVIPFEYDACYGAASGVAAVVKDGKCGLVDYQNNVVVPLEYDDISSCEKGVGYAIKDRNVYIIQLPAEKPIFTDVPEDTWYQEAVQWAVDNQITSGTAFRQFSPNMNCTRAQVVTFLWNQAGNPAPKSSVNPFKDVKSTDWYYDAVLWAVENEITSGTSATTFSPNKVCTRAEVVMFLQNGAEDPNPKSSVNPFKDVKTTDWYYSAVLWAVENEITSGTTATTFSPAMTCTRAQIVMFLYNDAQVM